MDSGQNLTISVHESLESLERLRPEWDALLDEYPYSTIFSTYEWLVPWWRAYGGEDRLLVLAFRDASSALVGLAPMALTTQKSFPFRLRVLRLMGDGSHDSDNLDLPVKPGFEDKFVESLLRFLESERNFWQAGELNTMPAQSPSGNALRRLFARERWVTIQKQSPASAIALPATWEEYLGQLSSEDQKNLLRYARRLDKRYTVQIYRCHAESQLDRCLEALFEHHQARWEAAGQSGSFGSPERRRFYNELSRSLLAQNRLDLWVLELDGTIAAAQFGFRFGRQFFQLQEGNDPAHAADRVGFLLRGHVMKQLVADGVRTYDFLGGELGYKTRWNAQSSVYTDIRFARPCSFGAVYLKCVQKANQSKSSLRRHLPKAAWNALHKVNLLIRRTGGQDQTPRAGSRPEKTDIPG